MCLHNYDNYSSTRWAHVGPSVGPTLQDQQLFYRWVAIWRSPNILGESVGQLFESLRTMIPYYGNPFGWLPLHQHSNIGDFYDTAPFILWFYGFWYCAHMCLLIIIIWLWEIHRNTIRCPTECHHCIPTTWWGQLIPFQDIIYIFLLDPFYGGFIANLHDRGYIMPIELYLITS